MKASSGHEATAGGLRLHWDASGRLEAFELAGEAVAQSAGGQYVFNGRSGLPSSVCLASEELNHTISFSDGTLVARWRDGERLVIVLEGHSAGGAVREVGFSLNLPPGDLSCLMGNVYRWQAYTPGQRISFTDFPLGVGQVYLLDMGDTCLRFGRQVSKKRDYPTGSLERTAEGWQLTWLWEPQLPYPEHFTSQELHFQLFDSVAAALEEHRMWGERALGWQPVASNPKVPAWFKECKLLLQVNLGETNGAVVHDYPDVTHLAEDLHAMGVPEGTILYLPDYNPNSSVLRGGSGPVCCLWPENPLLGGKREFVRMVRTAQKYGYHILPHGSILLLFEWSSLNYAGPDGKPVIWCNPTWEAMRQWAIVNAADQPIGWPPDEAADRYPYMVRYLNPGYREVQDYYLDGITAMIREHDLDCFYFDSVSVGPAISYQGNIPDLPAIIVGEREFMARLHERHPDVLFAGELCDEDNVDLVPMWQERSPMAYSLFGKYTYTFPHTVVAGPVPRALRGHGRHLHCERAGATRRGGAFAPPAEQHPTAAGELPGPRAGRGDAAVHRGIAELPGVVSAQGEGYGCKRSGSADLRSEYGPGDRSGDRAGLGHPPFRVEDPLGGEAGAADHRSAAGQLINLARNYGASFPVLSPGLFIGTEATDAAADREVADKLPASIELAHELGAKLLVTFSFRKTEGVPEAWVVDRLGRVAEATHGSGLTLVIEPLPGNYGDSGRALRRLVEQVGDPSCA